MPSLPLLGMLITRTKDDIQPLVSVADRGPCVRLEEVATPRGCVVFS